MNVAAILSAKGNTVEVVGPDTPVTVAVHRMATRGIGSLVVVGPDDQLIGVVGERDVVRAMDHHGERFRELRVRDVVNTSVATCTVDRRPRRGDAADDRHPLAPHARPRGRPGGRPDQHRRRRQAPPRRARAGDPRPPRRLPLAAADARSGSCSEIVPDRAGPAQRRSPDWRSVAGVKVTGRWSGPKMPTALGFQVISPSRARSGIRRASSGSASCSSARASAAPRQ